MQPGVRSPADAARWLLGAKKAVDRGVLFPASGRQAPRPAPDGSDDPWPELGPGARLLREFRTIVRSTHRVRIPGLTERVVLLQVSDAHLRWPGRHLDAVCGALQASEADAVLLTGDTITGGWRRAVADRLLDALPRTRFGAFSITGNWERIYDAPLRPWWQHLEARGVRVLDNAHIDLGPLVLAGTDDLCAGDWDPDRALAGAPPGRPIVVMSHSPAAFDELRRPGVRLVLSGHSHGGQVRLGRLGAPWLPKGTGDYTMGWFEAEGVHLFVCRGLGWSLAPIRWRCPPELARIELLPA
jgi:predicted MPP superfamily phosphohydrolase